MNAGRHCLLTSPDALSHVTTISGTRADVSYAGTAASSSLHVTHEQLQSTPEGVHARAIHHVRGGHAWPRGRGPSRGHAMLLLPSQHASPAVQWDKSILLRKALRTGIKSLETSLRMLVLPAILRQTVQQSRQRHSTSVQCRDAMYRSCVKASRSVKLQARCHKSTGYSL